MTNSSNDSVAAGDTPENAAPGALLHALRQRGYTFVTPTPATHARVLARANKQVARDLRDILGWNLPFRAEDIDPEIAQVLKAGGLLESASDGRVRSTVRVSSLGDALFVHSAYPTVQEDAVFFGPDSYRFADLIRAELPALNLPAAPVAVDIGTGAGVGAVVIKQLWPLARVIGTDINPKALRLAALNAEAAGLAIEPLETNTVGTIGVPLDIAVANPPYIIDRGKREYRDGGALYGGAIALEMVRDALGCLSPAGSVILYTGAAVVGGENVLLPELRALARGSGRPLRGRMLDPDVFGEELENEAYRDVERIELIAAVFGPPES